MTEHDVWHLSLEGQAAAFARNCHSQDSLGASQQRVPFGLKPLDLRYHAHNAARRRCVIAFCKGLFGLCDPVNAWIDMNYWLPITAAGE